MAQRFAKWPILSVAGVFVIVFYCVFTFTSIALFPTPFSPVVNYLSDLGNSSFNPSGAVFYNVGCVLTGLALFPFFAGLYKWYSNKLWRKLLLVLGQIAGFASGLALMMIGIFSEDYLPQHLFWSEVFFLLNLAVLFLVNIALLRDQRFIRPIGYYGLAVAVINVLFLIYGSTPLLEWFTVFTALGYVAMLAHNTRRIVLQAKP